MSKKKIFGFYMIVIGLVILFKILFPDLINSIYIFFVFLFVASLDFIIRAIKRRGRGRDYFFFIPGMTALLITIFLIFYYAFLYVKGISFLHLWPVLCLSPGLSLIAYYFISKRKSISIIVPGVFITLLSCVLLVFSLGFVQFRFRYFALSFIPIFFILMGIYFIVGENIIKDTDESDED